MRIELKYNDDFLNCQTSFSAMATSRFFEGLLAKSKSPFNRQKALHFGNRSFNALLIVAVTSILLLSIISVEVASARDCQIWEGAQTHCWCWVGKRYHKDETFKDFEKVAEYCGFDTGKKTACTNACTTKVTDSKLLTDYVELWVVLNR